MTTLITLPVEPAGDGGPSPSTDPTSDTAQGEQLELGLTTASGAPLRPSRVHVRFRLDAATRSRGLRHVAEIRARLAAPAAPDEALDATSEQPLDAKPGDAQVVELRPSTPAGRRAS